MNDVEYRIYKAYAEQQGFASVAKMKEKESRLANAKKAFRRIFECDQDGIEHIGDRVVVTSGDIRLLHNGSGRKSGLRVSGVCSKRKEATWSTWCYNIVQIGEQAHGTFTPGYQHQCKGTAQQSIDYSIEAAKHAASGDEAKGHMDAIALYLGSIAHSLIDIDWRAE
jgi:hypothetical protein